MSTDTIDDLHAAEDTITQLAAWLSDEPKAAVVFEAHRLANTYCRPSCGWLEDGECISGRDDCGCPCDHPD